MTFTLAIEMDNAAFKSDDGTIDHITERAELARILKKLAGTIGEASHSGTVFDFNGNRVGGWDIEEEDGADEVRGHDEAVPPVQPG